MSGGSNTNYTAQPTAQPAAAQPAAGQNVFQQAAGAYEQALRGPDIAQFANPFQQQVIDRSMADIGTAQQLAQRQLGQQATAARAFGGSRHGVAEALTNAGFIKQAADTSAGLHQQGFNTALGAAQQQQQMLSTLAGQGFGFGQQLNQQQAQAGQQQRAMLQALIDAARAQYGGFTGAPAQSLQLPMAALGAANMGQQTQTSTRNLGLFDYLTAAASMAAL